MTEPQQRLSDFRKIIVDFTKDVLGTFPELQHTLHADLRDILSEDMSAVMAAVSRVFEHCKSVYPTRFFDILYMNTSIFLGEAPVEADPREADPREADPREAVPREAVPGEAAQNNSTEFLPGMNFSTLWLENISEKTRKTIWKYLQLVLFAVVSDLQDGNSFGSAASLFEAINGDEFKAKLESTMKDMQDFFQTKEGGDDGAATDTAEGTAESTEGINLEDLPDPKSMHEHINSMMNGKLGKLAREIAEETAADLNINPENADSVNDVFKKLIQNPTKLMSLVKNVGTKLDEKLKAGDMKESDLMKEASDLMQQMKNMPGMGNLQSMFAKMGMPGMAAGSGSGKSKVDVNAMQAHLARNYKTAKTKEKLLERLAMRQQQAQQTQQQAQQTQAQQTQAQQTQAQDILVESTFQKGEVAVKSFMSDKPASSSKPQKKSKHKKKKKTSATKAEDAPSEFL